ncbi:MAG: ECF-type sigma factor [Gemmatimonadales bacterium]
MDQDKQAFDDLFSLAYEELRRLASSVHRDDPHASMNPTALVHEAWLKMARSPGLATMSQLHFKRIAARAMRQILVDAARRRNAHKRGAGVAVITYDDAIGGTLASADELIGLDAALDELARLNPRQASMVESRFFGGLETREIAEDLGISEATVLRDWRAAKAWLGRQLQRSL